MKNLVTIVVAIAVFFAGWWTARHFVHILTPPTAKGTATFNGGYASISGELTVTTSPSATFVKAWAWAQSSDNVAPAFPAIPDTDATLVAADGSYSIPSVAKGGKYLWIVLAEQFKTKELVNVITRQYHVWDWTPGKAGPDSADLTQD